MDILKKLNTGPVRKPFPDTLSGHSVTELRYLIVYSIPVVSWSSSMANRLFINYYLKQQRKNKELISF